MQGKQIAVHKKSTNIRREKREESPENRQELSSAVFWSHSINIQVPTRAANFCGKELICLRWRLAEITTTHRLLSGESAFFFTQNKPRPFREESCADL